MVTLHVSVSTALLEQQHSVSFTLQGHMSLLPKAIIFFSDLKFIKEYHIILSLSFISLWYQITMWKRQPGTSYLPFIKFSCIIKLVSYLLINWHSAHFKKLTKVTVHACPVFEPNKLAQVYQKLHLYTVESNKFTQVHICPDSELNKLFQAIQLLGNLKYRKIEKLSVILSFSSASAMVHSCSI